MDRTHFISNLTFNEYIFYLPVPVIGISFLFREMAAVGLFRTGPFFFFLLSTGTCMPITLSEAGPQSSLVFPLFPLCLQYGMWINNSWPVIRVSSIEDLLMEGRRSVSVPGGTARVVVSAPICQNAIRQTMEALISTSRPIIFKWLLAEECNQSITDKILLKASLARSPSLPLFSPSHPRSSSSLAPLSPASPVPRRKEPEPPP